MECPFLVALRSDCLHPSSIRTLSPQDAPVMPPRFLRQFVEASPNIRSWLTRRLSGTTRPGASVLSRTCDCGIRFWLVCGLRLNSRRNCHFSRSIRSTDFINVHAEDTPPFECLEWSNISSQQTPSRATLPALQTLRVSTQTGNTFDPTTCSAVCVRSPPFMRSVQTATSFSRSTNASRSGAYLREVGSRAEWPSNKGLLTPAPHRGRCMAIPGWNVPRSQGTLAVFHDSST